MSFVGKFVIVGWNSGLLTVLGVLGWGVGQKWEWNCSELVNGIENEENITKITTITTTTTRYRNYNYCRTKMKGKSKGQMKNEKK